MMARRARLTYPQLVVLHRLKRDYPVGRTTKELQAALEAKLTPQQVYNALRQLEARLDCGRFDMIGGERSVTWYAMNMHAIPRKNRRPAR